MLIYLVAGETSGDVLGGRLMTALQHARPDVTFAGVGGARMTEQGLTSLFSMHDLSVMGLVEILPKFRMLRRRALSVIADVARLRPDVVVTIDSPGFGLPVLRRVAPMGIRRVQYVAPQSWAWRPGRVKRYPGVWDSLLCLLPFEPVWFAERGLAAKFVGHPVLESGAGDGDGARFRHRYGIGANAPVVVLMPGSRRSEAPRLMPVFRQTMALVAAALPGIVPVIPASPAVAEVVERAAADWPVRPVIVSDTDDKHDAYAAAAAALTKSGTSTLELALAGVPMAVTYRVNPVSAALARRLIQVEHVAMVNLLAGRTVVPELLQQDCRPQRLANTLLSLLRDPVAAEAQRAAFVPLLAGLRPAEGSPSAAAAAAVLEG